MIAPTHLLRAGGNADASPPIDTARTPVSAATVALIGIAALCAFGWGIESSWPWYLRAVLCPGTALAIALVVPEREWRAHVAFEPLLVVVLVALLANAWIGGSGEVERRACLVVVGASVACFIVASLVPGEQLFRGIAAVIMAVLVVVLLQSVVDPATAYAPAAGEPMSLGLRSFFWQKNSLGLTLALATAVSAIVDDAARRWAMRGTILVVLLMSRSATALVVSIAVLVVQGLIAQIASGRRAGRQGVTFLVLITALALTVVLLGLRGRLFGVLGKTSDLTGRDEIWAGTWGAAQEHLMFGHGFGVFWSEDSLQRAELRRVVGWDVAGPHQGVLEIVTDFGLVGLALFVALVIIVGSRVVDRVSAGSLAKSHVVCAGLIVAIVLSSVTEATLLAPGLPILALTSGLLLNDQIAERIAADRRLPTTSRTTTVGAI
jgi:hypothetical protein